MIYNMKSLNEAVKAGGYLNLNKATRAIEIKHNHFFGRLVAAARYKMSKRYSSSVEKAKEKLILLMRGDTVYGRYFTDRTRSGMPDCLRGGKPISARQIHLFIEEVTTEADKSRDTHPVRTRYVSPIRQINRIRRNANQDSGTVARPRARRRRTPATGRETDTGTVAQPRSGKRKMPAWLSKKKSQRV